MKKKINILLIIAVLGLWGTAGYRFIRNYFVQEQTEAFQQATIVSGQKIVAHRDTFTLEPLARNPFLTQNNANSVSIQGLPVNSPNTIRNNRQVSKTEKITALWPEITYYGYIKSGKNNEVAVIKMNDQLIRLKKGEAKNKFLIKGIYKDSVVIIHDKEKRTFLNYKMQ